MESFFARAERIGHDIEKLKRGETIDSVITVNCVEELRSLLHDGASDDIRSARPAGVDPDVHETLSEQLIKRVQDFVFADRYLSDEDLSNISPIFPVEIRAVSAPDKTLEAGEVWSLGTSTAPVVFNLGTLIMEDRSSINIANTVLTFFAGTIIRNGGPDPSLKYDFGIFGVTGATPPQSSPGQDQNPAAPGTLGSCASPGIAGNDGGPGQGGGPGLTGDPGNTGGQGRSSQPASINIGPGGIAGDAGTFVILTMSGAGGQGGQGGNGGSGGSGGTGGRGATCGCTHTNGGPGGQGGMGGNGGSGGAGGDGVPGNDIYISVPSGQKNRIDSRSMTAPPGPGGTGGNGGPGGPGGGGGDRGGAGGCPQGSTGSEGAAGPVGNPGNVGPAGRNSGAPGNFHITEA